MTKKRAKKKTASGKKPVKKKGASSVSSHEEKAHKPHSISHRASHLGESNTEKILIENFVSLQKVMVNLSVKFDNLGSQISKLLDLFEISAKVLAEKGGEMSGENKELIEKLDNLLEQNKVIARGVALVHERERPEFGRGPSPPAMEMRSSVMQKPKVQGMPPSQTPPVERMTIERDNIENMGASPSKFKPLPKE